MAPPKLIPSWSSRCCCCCCCCNIQQSKSSKPAELRIARPATASCSCGLLNIIIRRGRCFHPKTCRNRRRLLLVVSLLHLFSPQGLQLFSDAWLTMLINQLAQEVVSGLHTDICLQGSSLQVAPGNKGKHLHDPVDHVQCIL